MSASVALTNRTRLHLEPIARLEHPRGPGVLISIDYGETSLLPSVLVPLDKVEAVCEALRLAAGVARGG